MSKLMLVLVIALLIGAAAGLFIAYNAYEDSRARDRSIDIALRIESIGTGGICGAIAAIIVALIAYFIF